MLRSIANFFSYVFHPLLIPTFCFYTAMILCPEEFNTYPERKLKLSLMILFALTCLFPSIIYIMMHKLEMIDDLDVRDKKQRIIPYLVALFFYLAAFLCFKPRVGSLFIDQVLIVGSLLGATLSLCISFFANNFLKVSLHSNGVGGFFAFCIIASFYATQSSYWVVALSIIIMGIISASRIILEAHTPREVIAGLASGMLGQYLAYKYYITA
ncbi:MAG: phosphatase PAP2 family protein [Bacteroidetes bacterium]|nr:phosphatase PAP2 family protein [Bacteroidota bacterium]MBP7477818.1 phosphatase PAP2 family protein [Chitinophagales bacterium]